MSELIAMSASGRFVALRREGGVEVVDIKGTAPRRTFGLAAGGAFAIVGSSLCLLDRELRVIALENGRERTLDVMRGEMRPAFGRAAATLIVGGSLVAIEPEVMVVASADGTVAWWPLVGRSVVAVAAGACSVVTGARVVPLAVPPVDEVLGVAPLFGGRMIAVLAVRGARHEAIVVQASGQFVHRIAVPAARWHAFASGKGQLLLGSGGDDVVVVDLRYGRVCGHGRGPHAIAAAAIDEEGREVVLATPGETGVPVVSVLQLAELVGQSIEDEPEPTSEPVTIVVPDVVVTAVEPAAVALPEHVPLALGAPLQHTRGIASHAVPFATAREHLAALLDLVATRAALAIAEAWHSGRISSDAADTLPFEREVLGLAGESCGLAGEQVELARVRLLERAEVVSARTLATLAAGIALPFVEVAQELALSEAATQVLLAVLAAASRPEIARLYRILGNETNRPTCDDALVCQLLAGGDAAVGDRVLDELAPDAVLLHAGAIDRRGRGLEINAALLDRLRGRAVASGRRPDRALADLHVDRAAVAGLIEALRVPQAAPARVVMRGPRGAGRHTIIACLAARIDHGVLAIDATTLPRTGLADALARQLANAHLTRCVPVVSGLELGSTSDHDDTLRVQQAIARHRGPVVVRCGLDARLPLEPGFIEVVLPPLPESARQRAFAAALDEVSIAADTRHLASRYRIAPGVMHRVARAARERLGRAEPDAAVGTRAVDEAARQHVASRIGATAQRVTRLAEWDQVALPEDMLDSLRELVGRARHARTVYEEWGYDTRVTSARGLTALFYGPPGTGKTMVAGLLARELGLELYRVDLSKVMSKWVGETEKNLGEVFDAAQDGQVMLLFDEADSLFAKRSEVKTSNDRYANLEVNYLLQRLDSFEGIAILTTNLEGSIDPAFKRRLSMRMYFPFPDEEIRARLWQAHVMPRMPTAGNLDFEALARRFPLSGGYIRNSALRAAFLAAQEQTELTQTHLERAVLLEYRELGKLADDGRME